MDISLYFVRVSVRLQISGCFWNPDEANWNIYETLILKHTNAIRKLSSGSFDQFHRYFPVKILTWTLKFRGENVKVIDFTTYIDFINYSYKLSQNDITS